MKYMKELGDLAIKKRGYRQMDKGKSQLLISRHENEMMN